MYALFSCDAWRSRKSMEFKGVFDKEKLVEVAKKEFEKEIQEAIEDGGINSRRQLTVSDLINQKVDCIYVQECDLNELF